MRANLLKFSAGIILFFSVLTPYINHDVESSASKQVDISGTRWVPILTYHRVLPKALSKYDITPAQLEGQLKFLKDHNYQPITALQYMEYRNKPELFPEKPVVLTFDDGHISHYTQVFPLLQKYRFPATFFVCTSAVSEKVDSKTRLTWPEILRMAGAGMDIESHTVTHPFLDKQLPKEDYQSYLKRVDYELTESKTILESKLHHQVDLLAYPYGWFDSVVEAEALKAGYRGLFTVNWGNNSLGGNVLRIKRRVMDSTISGDGFAKLLAAKPLSIEIISPPDTAIVSGISAVKFRLPDTDLKNVTIYIGPYKKVLTPDSGGSYSFANILRLKPGYHMIIVKGYDSLKNLYLGSWGFEYRAPK